jgi:hypothetical protein
MRRVSPAAAAVTVVGTILLPELRAGRRARSQGSGAASHSCPTADIPPSPTEAADAVRMGHRRSVLEGPGCRPASGSTIPGRPLVLPRPPAREPPAGRTRPEVVLEPRASAGAPPSVPRSPEPAAGMRVEPAVGHAPATDGRRRPSAACAAVEPVVPLALPRVMNAAAATKRAAASGAPSVDREAEWSGPGPGRHRTARSARFPRLPAHCIGDRRSPFVCFLASQSAQPAGT